MPRKHVCLLFCISLAIADTAKLNVPRILLPEDSLRTSYFNLRVVEGGDCYQWRSSRPDLIQVVLDGNVEGRDCSNSAIVSLAPLASPSLAKQKATAFILAEGEGWNGFSVFQQDIMPQANPTNHVTEMRSYYAPEHGETLYCDVVVSSINRIEIFVRTHEIFLDDVGQITARAFDDQGNEFSTLDGLAMEWRIEPINRMESDLIRLVNFEDSKYDATESVEKLEKQGKRGDMILIEGAKTGTAKISVKFTDPSLTDVPVGEVRMTVIANIALDPPRIHVLPGSSVYFRVIQFRHGRLEQLPQSEAQQYLLQISNDSIAKVTDAGLFKVTAYEKGETQVVLRDPNLDDEGPHPTATVIVTMPAKLKLSLLPHRNWVTMEGNEHVLDVEIFDEFDNKIHPSEEVSVRTQIAPRFVEVKNATVNGTWSHILASSSGVGKVKATLKQLTLPDGSQLDVKPPVKATADIEIYQSIIIDPTVRLYPWDPVTKPKYETKFKATGGGDSFIWASSNTSIASVSQTGLSATGGIVGATNISAAMLKNQKMRGVAKIFVQPAVDVKINLHVFEFEEKSAIFVPIGLLGRIPDQYLSDGLESLQVFSDCSQIPFSVDLTDKKNFAFTGEISYSGVYKTCAQAKLATTGVGSSKVTVSYTIEGTTLKDIITLSTYRKLRPITPSSGVTVLSLGASRTVVFEGGPLPWIMKPSGHFHNLAVENATLVKATKLQQVIDDRTGRKDFYSVTVTCLELGETKAIVRIGNVASSTNQNPVVLESAVTVICAEPRSIDLLAEVKRPEGAPMELCVADPVTQRVKSQSYEDLRLVVTLKDAESRKFDNFSTVSLAWSLSDPSLGSLEPVGELPSEQKQLAILSSPVSDKYFRVLKPHGKPGPLDVTVSLSGYDSHALKHEGVRGHRKINVDVHEDVDLSTEVLNLLLVDDVSIDPKEQTVFNHPNNALSLLLHAGSGVFGTSLDKKEIASFVYNPENQTLQVIPICDGVATVSVKDLCLTTRTPGSSVVRVASLERIEIEGPEKVALGSSITVHVRILDTTGNQLSVGSAKLLNLKEKAEGNFVSLRFEPDASTTDFVYTVVGLQIGLASVSFFADKGIRSTVLPVEVFAPLKLEPKSLTLIIGSTFQLKAVDGPQPDPNLSYSVDDSTIASVSQSGRISALSLGHTRIAAKSMGPRNYIYGEDVIDLYVIPFNGVNIRVPTVKIVEGGELPATVWGRDDRHTPFAFGMMQQKLSFKWSTHGSGKAKVRNALHEAGLNEDPSDKDFSIKFIAENAGVVRLRVKVTLSGTTSVYEDEVQIEVIPRLAVTLNQNAGFIAERSTIMSVNSKLTIGANRKTDVRVDYKSNGNVTVDTNGLVRAGSTVGYGTILVTSYEGVDLVQRMTILIEVLPVAYMMLVPKPLGVSVSSPYVPTGYTLTFESRYYDHLGRQFDSEAGRVETRSSRFDLTESKFQQNTVIVKTQQTGQTVFRFQDSVSPNLLSYLGITSVEGIVSQDHPLTVGDFVCFRGLAQDGSFRASGPVVVDASKGVGFVTAQGAVDVSHVAGNQVTVKHLLVKEPTKVEFVSTPRTYVTDADSKTVFTFPVVFLADEVKESNLIGGDFCDRAEIEKFAQGHRLPFDCHLAFSKSVEVNVYDVFRVKSAFEVLTGRYICVVEVASSPSASNSAVDSDLLLSVQGRTASLANSTQVQFRPAIYLQNQELHFTNLQTELSLLISGVKGILQEVQVRSSDPTLLTVGVPEYRQPSALVVPIKLRPDYWTLEDGAKLSVSVLSPQTGQSVTIPVHVRLMLTDRDRCSIPVRERSWVGEIFRLLEDYQLWFVTMLTGLATIMIIFGGLRCLRGTGYRVTSDEAKVFVSPKTSPLRPGSSPASPFSPTGTRLWTVDHDASYGRYSPPSSQMGSPPPYSQTPGNSFYR